MFVGLISFAIKFILVLSYSHQKPVPKTLWPEPCAKGDRILNDCNWCSCEGSKFICKARDCSGVDMFGHFKDNVAELHVGMEGHGVWRSRPTACTPGVQYVRKDLVCICGQNGSWPNPICRDKFRVLHSVELTDLQRPEKQSCFPSRLYVIGCNVCLCPSTGTIDHEMCTKENCDLNDPILQSDDTSIEDNHDDIFAECHEHYKYKIGCRSCICLRNNRLLCEECNKDVPENKCNNLAPGVIFNEDCNLCVCNNDKIYCTTKKCLDANGAEAKTLRQGRKRPAAKDLFVVERPYNEIECVQGTVYKQGCNDCVCYKGGDGTKIKSCTLKGCNEDVHPIDRMKLDCVVGTFYEQNCVVCRCESINGVKRETCYLASKCTGSPQSEPRSKDLLSLHGYCEPSHTYVKDCNTCHCLSDGKLVMCTALVCEKNVMEKPITVDIVPVTQNIASQCPKDHMYKVDCNICLCLTNGNVLCTTAVCNSNKTS